VLDGDGLNATTVLLDGGALDLGTIAAKIIENQGGARATLRPHAPCDANEPTRFIVATFREAVILLAEVWKGNGHLKLVGVWVHPTGLRCLNPITSVFKVLGRIQFLLFACFLLFLWLAGLSFLENIEGTGHIAKSPQAAHRKHLFEIFCVEAGGKEQKQSRGRKIKSLTLAALAASFAAFSFSFSNAFSSFFCAFFERG
jgi:hypothetical protein